MHLLDTIVLYASSFYYLINDLTFINDKSNVYTREKSLLRLINYLSLFLLKVLKSDIPQS